MTPQPSQVIEHPSLGSIKGALVENNSIEQFRGIPFGTIPARWTDPVLLHGKLSQETFDATRFGPACPQGAGGQEGDVSLVGNMKFQAEPVVQNETDCLNLVISRPAGVSLDAKLPVMVWVHGGGFCLGCNAWPQYDLAKFVRCASDKGKPIICVSINYRVGIFGFLASGKSGISGNFGLKDQICAFQWVKQYIAGFGGCPSSVTAFGESAGAISLSTLLATSEPLFSRAILMSGDVSLRRPRSLAWQDKLLHENLTSLSLQHLDLTTAIERLRTLPAASIVQTIPLLQHWSPTIDEVLLSGLQGPDFYIENAWCKSVMLGDMAQDGTILRSRYLNDPKAREKTKIACRDILEASMSRQVQEAYDLDATEPYTGMLHFITEIRFYLPVIAAAKGLRFPKNVLVQEYHMDQINPFDGDYHGSASHVLDLGYLLRNFDPWLDEINIDFGKRMLGIWVGFAYAENEKSGQVLALGPNHEITYSKSGRYDQRQRRGRARMLLEMGLAKSVTLGERLQGVPHPEL